MPPTRRLGPYQAQKGSQEVHGCLPKVGLGLLLALGRIFGVDLRKADDSIQIFRGLLLGSCKIPHWITGLEKEILGKLQSQTKK